MEDLIGDDTDFAGSSGGASSVPHECDITHGVPDGLVHVDIPRIGHACRRLKIEYGKAIVGWNEFKKHGRHHCHPVTSGVVIRRGDHARLIDDVKQKRKLNEARARRLSVVAALFTLNRRAKRCRDLAQRYYLERMHGFAHAVKLEKEQIYRLKEQVLQHLVQSGLLKSVGYHQFGPGIFAEVLEGQGYRFHRPCPPPEAGAEMIENIEAKPKDAKEPTLDIAHKVIGDFLDGKEVVKVFRWPSR